MVLLDLQKAFDTVDYNILLGKLEALGIQESALKWFKAYLENRQQSVDIRGIRSAPTSVTWWPLRQRPDMVLAEVSWVCNKNE